MKNNNELSRRDFLLTASALSASTVARLSVPALAAITQAACSARDRGNAYKVLSRAEAADFTAIAARIIPTTDTPGATEAGVIHFFDNAFAADMSDRLDEARAGLAALNDSLTSSGGFAALDAAQQDDALRQIESGAFFGLMRWMTICGYFAMSEYGGNRDHVGWKVIGFEGHHGGWQSPFGYYDAQVLGGSGDDE